DLRPGITARHWTPRPRHRVRGLSELVAVARLKLRLRNGSPVLLLPGGVGDGPISAGLRIHARLSSRRGVLSSLECDRIGYRFFCLSSRGTAHLPLCGGILGSFELNSLPYRSCVGFRLRRRSRSHRTENGNSKVLHDSLLKVFVSSDCRCDSKKAGCRSSRRRSRFPHADSARGPRRSSWKPADASRPARGSRTGLPPFRSRSTPGARSRHASWLVSRCRRCPRSPPPRFEGRD